MKYKWPGAILLALFFGVSNWSEAQDPGYQNPVGAVEDRLEVLRLHVQPVFNGMDLKLDQTLCTGKGDTLKIQTLRFYLSSFVLLHRGQEVYAEQNSFHLLDLEDPHTLDLTLELPGNTAFDRINFNLGIDSLTQISGAMGGDLDPTKGMFWTWQSGYIQVKLEGVFEKWPARNQAFQFHLGGYLAPFQSLQSIRLQTPQGRISGIKLELNPFFEQVEWDRHSQIMSPSAETLRLSHLLAQCFKPYAD